MGFEVACPHSIEEAFEYASRFEGPVAYLSGGTDLLVRLQKGEEKAGLVIDISQIPELAYVENDKDKIKIGSTTSFASLAKNGLILQHANCLAQAASQVGSVQIRNRGTIGGNIASASPAGDSLPALLVLEAWLTLNGPEGRRRVSFASIQSGQEELRQRELITEIDFPVSRNQYISGFHKLGSRKAVSIARLNMAWMLKINRENNLIQEARLAVGALGKTPLRLQRIEQALANQIINHDLLQKTAEMLTEIVDESIPGRPSQEYKRSAIKGLAFDMFEDFLVRWGEEDG